jgi:hypothetical protein
MGIGTTIKKFPVRFFILSVVILLLAGIEVWAYFSPLPGHNWNAKNLKMINVSDSDNFFFSVFGGSDRKAGVFENMIKVIDHDPDILFAISLGDVVHAGNKENYRYVLRQVRDNLGMPLLTTVGSHELSGKGLSLYQDIFGSFYYSFLIGGNCFIILNDSDGQGIDPEQKKWLENQLILSQGYSSRIVFMHTPLFDPRGGPSHECLPEDSSISLLKLFQQYRVTHIFASHIAGFFTGQWQGIPYTVSGGAGATLAGDDPDHYFYHFLKVSIVRGRVDVLARPIAGGERASKNNIIFDVEKVLSIFSLNIVKLALMVFAVGLAAGIYRSGTVRR